MNFCLKLFLNSCQNAIYRVENWLFDMIAGYTSSVLDVAAETKRRKGNFWESRIVELKGFLSTDFIIPNSIILRLNSLLECRAFKSKHQCFWPLQFGLFALYLIYHKFILPTYLYYNLLFYRNNHRLSRQWLSSV